MNDAELQNHAHLAKSADLLVVAIRSDRARARARARARSAPLRGALAYDTRDFVAACRARGATPHVAQNKHARRRSAIDRRTTRHEGYGLSQRMRRCIERIFGWVKEIGGLRRTRFRGRDRTQLAATMVAAAYNLLRMSRLVAAA